MVCQYWSILYFINGGCLLFVHALQKVLIYKAVRCAHPVAFATANFKAGFLENADTVLVVSHDIAIDLVQQHRVEQVFLDELDAFQAITALAKFRRNQDADARALVRRLKVENVNGADDLLCAFFAHHQPKLPLGV